MKNFTYLFFVMLLSAFSWQGMAQVAIGEEGPTTSSIPISGCWKYSYTQQLVYSNEVNASGDITSISFYYTSGGYDNSLEWDIYLGHTSKTMFEDTSDWVDYSSLEQVYSGTVTFPDANEWMTITFDTPFTYNGTDNLVIGVDENMDGYSCSAYFGGTPNVLDSHRSIIYRSDSTNPDPVAPPTATTRLNYINTMILGGIQQSCPTPTDLIASNASQTSVDVDWTESGSATEWEVVYGLLGFDPSDSAVATTVSITGPATSTTLTGLDHSTVYEFYVKAICGVNDESGFSAPMSFATTCAFAQVPYLLDFETAEVPGLPNCTSHENNGIGNDWKTKGGTTSGFTGNVLNYSYHLSSAVGPANSWFYTQGIELEAGVNYDISYKYGNNSTIWTESMKVAYGTSPAETAMTNQLADYPSIELTTPEEALITFTVATDGVYYFGFNAYSIENQNQLYLDDISIVASPSCPAPSDLIASNITTDSANIAWTESTTATQWEVVYGEAGFDPLTEGDTVSANDDSEATLSDLMASTLYDFYVKAICGVNDESVLTGPVSFRTTCDAIVSLPYLEDFDTYGVGPEAFPDCWERITYTSGTSIWPSIVSQNATSGPGSVKFQSAVGTPTYAISPPFAEDITNLRVTFMLQREGASSGTIDVGVMSDVSDTDTFELVQTINPAHNNHQEYTIDLNQVSLSGSDNFIALRHNSNSSIWYYWLDDFEVNLIPVCVGPTALAVTNISGTTADIEWTAGESETSWEVSWGTLGYTPGDTDEINTATVTTTDYQIIGLDMETSYDVYVRAVCGENSESLWVGPETFSTLCGVTVAPWSEDFEGGANENVLVEDLSCWSQEYVSGTEDWKLVNQNGNGTIQPRSGTLMAEFRVATFSEPATKLISPVLDLSELTTPQLTFYFANAAWGTDIDQLRVYYKANASDATWTLIPDAEYTAEHASWEKVELILPEGNGATDYVIAFEGTSSYARGLNLDDISVSEATATSCDAVTDVEVSEITAETATVSWTASATAADGYVVNVYEAGADVDTDTAVFTEVVGVGVTTVDVTGLTHLTSYDVYVTSDCGSGEMAISDVVTFTTDDIASVGDFDFVKLTLYPNPVSTDLNISAAKVIDEVQVYNILGQRVMTHKSNNTEVTLDVTRLPSATYVLKVSVEGVMSTARFIKK